MTTRADTNNGASPNGSQDTIPDRLMRGEDSASRSRDDIDHWIRAYTELLTFKDGLLRDMETGMQALSRTASAEIRDEDVNLIVGQRAHYLRRLEFWRGRKAEVGRQADDPAIHASVAERALAADRLLAGEDPESHDVEAARHWSAVYEELIGFKQKLLAELRKTLPSLPPMAATEVRSFYMAITRQQMERYFARRDYWEKRTRELVAKRPGAVR